MRDAIDIIGKTLQIKEVKYIISKLYFVPGTNKLYIGITKADNITINYSYNDLLPFLIEQLKL